MRLITHHKLHRCPEVAVASSEIDRVGKIEGGKELLRLEHSKLHTGTKRNCIQYSHTFVYVRGTREEDKNRATLLSFLQCRTTSDVEESCIGHAGVFNKAKRVPVLRGRIANLMHTLVLHFSLRLKVWLAL